VIFKNILVPFDGSKNSIRGLDMAIYIAKQFHGTITVMTVKSMPEIYSYNPLRLLDFDSITEIKKLLNNAKIGAEKKGILLTTKIFEGDPGYIITKFANNKRNGIDLVVIGSRGRSSAKETFLGSVSNHVLHKSKKPVLIVK
jgi:nucleotide-binding universal stress UspA family protein